jgi:hypothetical protein
MRAVPAVLEGIRSPEAPGRRHARALYVPVQGGQALRRAGGLYSELFPEG